MKEERSRFRFRSLTQPISMPVNVDLPLAVGIPADYIADQDLASAVISSYCGPTLMNKPEIDASGL